MIEEKATIVAVEPGYAWVETQRKSTCGQCSARAGCGTSVIAKVVGNRLARVRALNPHAFSNGQNVVVGVTENTLVKSAFVVYMTPLFALFAGAGLPLMLGVEADGLSVLAGLAGFAAGLLWVRKFSQRISSDARYQAVVLRSCSQSVNFKSPVTSN